MKAGLRETLINSSFVISSRAESPVYGQFCGVETCPERAQRVEREPAFACAGLNQSFLSKVTKALRGMLRSDEAAALAEFAVALPLLIVLVVGIYDFGGAFNTKQELNNALREGARFGAAQPTNDLSYSGTTAPPSVDAIRYVVDAYMLQAKINDCGLSGAPLPSRSGGSLVWTYGANGCPLALQLTIQRDCGALNGCAEQPGCAAESFQGGAVTIYPLCTQIWISYPYQWHFNNVLQVLIPGGKLVLTNITTQATAVNMD